AQTMALAEKIRHTKLEAGGNGRGGSLDGNHAQIGALGDTFHFAGVGNEDDIVLVGVHNRKSLGSKHTKDFERYVTDAYDLADRVLVGKQLRDNRFSNNTHLGRATHILLGKHRTVVERPVADVQIVRAFSENLSVPIQTVRKDLLTVTNFRADTNHPWYLPSDGVRVVDGHRAGATPAAPRPAAGKVAGKNKDDILPETGDLRLDLLLRAGAYSDHGNDRADTNDDAQGGE